MSSDWPRCECGMQLTIDGKCTFRVNHEIKTDKTMEKKIKSGLRKCKGHWINKKMQIRDDQCYNAQGQCLKCGGWR